MRCTKLSIFYEHNFTSFSPRPSGCYGIPTPPTCRAFSCLIIIFTFNETLNWSDFDSTFLINGIHFGWLWLILRTSIRHVGQNVGAWKKSIVVARKNRIWKWWIWFDDTNGPSSAGDVVTFSLTSHYFHWHLIVRLISSRRNTWRSSEYPNCNKFSNEAKNIYRNTRGWGKYLIGDKSRSGWVHLNSNAPKCELQAI